MASPLHFGPSGGKREGSMAFPYRSPQAANMRQFMLARCMMTALRIGHVDNGARVPL